MSNELQSIPAIPAFAPKKVAKNVLEGKVPIDVQYHEVLYDWTKNFSREGSSYPITFASGDERPQAATRDLTRSMEAGFDSTTNRIVLYPVTSEDQFQRLMAIVVNKLETLKAQAEEGALERDRYNVAMACYVTKEGEWRSGIGQFEGITGNMRDAVFAEAMLLKCRDYAKVIKVDNLDTVDIHEQLLNKFKTCCLLDFSHLEGADLDHQLRIVQSKENEIGATGRTELTILNRWNVSAALFAKDDFKQQDLIQYAGFSKYGAQQWEAIHLIDRKFPKFDLKRRAAELGPRDEGHIRLTKFPHDKAKRWFKNTLKGRDEEGFMSPEALLEKLEGNSFEAKSKKSMPRKDMTDLLQGSTDPHQDEVIKAIINNDKEALKALKPISNHSDSLINLNYKYEGDSPVIVDLAEFMHRVLCATEDSAKAMLQAGLEDELYVKAEKQPAQEPNTIS